MAFDPPIVFNRWPFIQAALHHQGQIIWSCESGSQIKRTVCDLFVGACGSSHGLCMTSSGSLRDLYSSSPSSWSFIPSQSNLSSTSTPTKPEWSTRPNTNPVFDLSPSFPLEHNGLNVDLRVELKNFFASELLQYTGTALVMPWEVGKILLQIQWVPRDSAYLETEGGHVVEEDEVLILSGFSGTSIFLTCLFS